MSALPDRNTSVVELDVELPGAELSDVDLRDDDLADLDLPEIDPNDSIGDDPRIKHIRHHPGRRFILAAALLEGLVLLLAIVFIAGLWPAAAAWSLVTMHIVAAALAAWGWQSMRADPFAGDEWRLAALAIAALGPLGVVGTALFAGLRRAFERNGASNHPSWLSVVSAAGDDSPVIERAEVGVEATLARQATVVPFVDVLASGSIEQKQDMISVIANNYRPTFSRTLRAAMNDAEPTVRVMAAAATSRIENEFLDSSMSLENDWANEPQETQRSLDLARHYDAFANTGLLDESRANEARSRALEMYQLVAREHPRDDTIAQAIIRLLLKLGREEEAIGLYRKAMEEGSASTTLASWYLECLFRRKRFAELRRFSEMLCARTRDMDLLNDRSLQAAQLWGSATRTNTELQVVDVLIEDSDVLVGTREQRRDRVKFELPYFRPNLPT